MPIHQLCDNIFFDLLRRVARQIYPDPSLLEVRCSAVVYVLDLLRGRDEDHFKLAAVKIVTDDNLMAITCQRCT